MKVTFLRFTLIVIILFSSHAAAHQAGVVFTLMGPGYSVHKRIKTKPVYLQSSISSQITVPSLFRCGRRSTRVCIHFQWILISFAFYLSSQSPGLVSSATMVLSSVFRSNLTQYMGTVWTLMLNKHWCPAKKNDNDDYFDCNWSASKYI